MLEEEKKAFYLIRDIVQSIKAAQDELRYIEIDEDLDSLTKKTMLKQASNVRLNRFNKLYEVVKVLDQYLETDGIT